MRHYDHKAYNYRILILELVLALFTAILWFN